MTKRLILILLLFPAFTAWADEPEDVELIDGDRIYTVLEFDGIPAIDDPVFVSAAEADSFLNPDEMMIGVSIGDEARAYSTWHLDGHEIVNDVVGGTPIAATW